MLLTFLVDDVVRRRFPFLLGEDLHGHYVALNSTVHVLASDKQHRLLKCWNRDCTLFEEAVLLYLHRHVD